jgi:fructose-specific phosphotransferase system IIA component
MNIRKAICKESISLEIKAREKIAIIEELLDLLVRAGKITDRKAALKCLLEREKKMSTGMHNGLAIPHGKTDSVDSLVAAIGILREGVDFESMDGELSRIFILTVSPANRAGPHIQFLAEISRLLNRSDVRQQLLDAKTAEEIHEIMTASP